MIGTIGMPSKTQADIGEIELKVKIKIAEEASEDILLQEIATEIARAESGFNPNAKNPKSTATGIFQFIKGTWKKYCEGDRLNYEDNVACAVRMLSEGGYSHWDASKSLWWPKLSSEAKQRIKFGKEEDLAYKKLEVAGGLVLVDLKGNVISNGKVFTGGGEEIPHL